MSNFFTPPFKLILLRMSRRKTGGCPLSHGKGGDLEVWPSTWCKLKRLEMSTPKASRAFKQWCARELSKILNSSVEDALLDYLLSIEGEKDMREYLHDIVGDSTKQAQTFMQEFFNHWQPPSQSLDLTSSQDASENTVMQAIARPEAEQMVLFQKSSESQSEVLILTSRTPESWNEERN